MNNTENTLPAEGLIDTKTVISFLSLSPSTWSKLVASGKVHKPVKFGRANRWDVDYIRELGKTGIS